ncbi:MAG: N(5)-(carboxyethyl)ornithine synthase [Solirubrobacteraceae bacterium]
MLNLGLVGSSRKPHERRLPVHPSHLERLPDGLEVFVEEGYGARFGRSDDELAPLVAGVLPREEILRRDVVVLPKPESEDLLGMREGGILWGWPHCVQGREITQAAIDRRLTLIAWEAMNFWGMDGRFARHVFHRNNELAGYCSVTHALALLGSTAAYGRPLSAAVIGYGATGRGAVNALIALGFPDIHVLTQREAGAVRSPDGVQVTTYGRETVGPTEAFVVDVDDGHTPLAEFLAGSDVVVNCVFQDPLDPLVFVHDSELERFGPRNLFVDVSIDEGMGFEWARPTSFDEPMLTIGPGSHYYAVDHSPSYLWNSATWEVSEALLPYAPLVAAGPDAWDADETLRRAIEIRDGVIVNPKILEFQNRAAEYPHPPVA